MKCNTCSSENVDGARFCASCGAVLAVADAPKNTLVGQTVGGRYHVKRVLGEGGMGIVYEAEQQMGSTARKVALKTLHAHLSHDPSISQRFHRECGTIAQLEHPNTIKVYDFGATDDGTLYIAMEFVAGESLAKVIEGAGALPPDRALRIIRQIAGSLDEAHSQGVIHRDLKPDNIVLTSRAGEKDVVKLLDFGIAARTESADAQKEQKLTQQGMVLGTPPYMSPEQFTGKALDARSDIYSLGVVAYEMVTGRLPFDANTPWQWATEHMTAQPIPFEATPVSSRIPESMRVGILRALAKDRDARQSSAKQFCDELAGDGAAPAVAPGASTGTAAMAAPPAFAGGAAPAEVGPARTAAMPSAAAAPTPAHAVAASVASPAAGGPAGGNKGLVFGLAAIGGLLLLGIVIVGARSMKSAPDAAAPPPATVPVATVAPQVESAQTAEVPPPIPTPERAEPREPATKPGASEHPGQKPGAGEKPKAAADPCGACISAATAGNFASASANFGACTDAAQKAQCAGVARKSAPAAAKEAAFLGNCSKAKSIVAAGEAMGVDRRGFGPALAACK